MTNFMLSSVEQEKMFITLGPGLNRILADTAPEKVILRQCTIITLSSGIQGLSKIIADPNQMQQNVVSDQNVHCHTSSRF